MSNKTVVIIGAGPSGLACAYELIKSGQNIKPIIVEKLDCVGGLSRTVYFDKFGVDIGGHRLHTDNEYIKKIWLDFLPVQNAPSVDDVHCNRNVQYPKKGLNPNIVDDVMLIRNRFSSIIYNSNFFDYPIKLSFSTLKKLGFFTSVKAGFSYIKTFFTKREEKSLEDFMINRFGCVLYEIFFKDYTKKVWGIDPSELSSEWGHERIRKLSLFKTLLNAILSCFSFLKFKKETSLIDKFYYPKYGCSQLWDLMAKYIVQNGGQILLNSEFVNFEAVDDKITTINIRTNEKLVSIKSNYFVSSIPIKDLIKGIDVSFDVKQKALSLPYRDYILVSFCLNDFKLKNKTKYPTVNNITPDCWLYLQEKDAKAARIQIMNNWSPYLVGDYRSNYIVSLEYFVNEDEEFWLKTDNEIVEFAIQEAIKYNLFDTSNVQKTKVVREKKAYPTYHGTYKNILEIKNALYFYNNLYLIGRNGLHKYNNMDEAMVCGINVAKEIIKK